MSSALTLRVPLPLAWSTVEESAVERERTSLAARNAQVLNAIIALEAGPGEHSDEEHGLAPQLKRLDAKLDLAVDLIGELLLSQHPLPPPKDAALTTTEAVWIDQHAPEERQLVLVEVYLSPRYPRAVRLPARVRQVEAVADGQMRVEAVFDLAPEAVQEKLERALFLMHRRQIGAGRRR